MKNLADIHKKFFQGQKCILASQEARWREHEAESIERFFRAKAGIEDKAEREEYEDELCRIQKEKIELALKEAEMDRQISDISGPVVTFVESGVDGWKIDRLIRTRKCSSIYWKNQPNGLYPLVIRQGGIINREVLRSEKIRLSRFLSKDCKMPADFAGTATIEVYNGEITNIKLNVTKRS